MQASSCFYNHKHNRPNNHGDDDDGLQLAAQTQLILVMGTMHFVA